MNRIKPFIEEKLPTEQAGFRTNRSCNEQVTALTTSIENSFQRDKKSMAVFVDLTYDTIWRKGILLKFVKMILMQKINVLVHP